MAGSTSGAGTRRRRGQATRRKVAEAAARLFAEHGYAATTIQAIADEAGVHAQTIYLAFGTKAAVLAEAGAVLVAGDDDPASHPSERPWVLELQAEPDPVRKLQLYARHIHDIAPRCIPLFDMMRATAPDEPEVAAFLAHAEAGRYAGPYNLLPPLIEAGALRAGLTLSDAADITFTVASFDSFRSLVTQRGWTWDRAEAWIADALCRLLLAETAGGKPSTRRPSARPRRTDVDPDARSGAAVGRRGSRAG
jgi:AcrR family transcriptional regulator